MTIDPNATLIFSSTTITGGTINDGTIANTGGPSGGTIEVLGAATITGGATLNDGVVRLVSDNVTLTLNGVTIERQPTINDGTVSQYRRRHRRQHSRSPGRASSTRARRLNNGAVAVSAATTLTLDDVTVTGTTITDANATTERAADRRRSDADAVRGDHQRRHHQRRHR